MNKKTSSARKRLIEQWNEVTGALTKFNGAAEVRPENGDAVFVEVQGGTPGVITFELSPVVFNLPERANHVALDLFIVVSGRLGVQEDSVASGDVLLTHDFSTRAAYFRRTRAGLAHVYGAHYDFALNELGHPTFHMQLRSFADLGRHVTEQYRVNADISDELQGILRNVRLPCAQMDFFSFFTQLCADHLLFKDSEKEVLATFNHLVQNSSFLKGAGGRSERLADDSARTCYRARHWYPVLA